MLACLLAYTHIDVCMDERTGLIEMQIRVIRHRERERERQKDGWMDG
jgi:hypothetical protein